MKKCIVLDLDNTLWGGIVGEDGIDGLKLSTTAPGNAFLAFQQALLDHYNRGIILAINSRNNEEDALAVIRSHPNQILKEHHFAARRINWNDKAANIVELAKELNIGLDSMVFLDDDKTNREMVRALVPEVEVPELPDDPTLYTQFLHALPYFESKVLTDEDTMRGNLYVTERLRKESEKEFTSKEDFLTSLGLELHVYKDDTSCLARLAQLTEKTNQFNIDKHPYTEEELRAFAESDTHHIFYGRLLDTFGDYGVVIFGITEKRGDSWHIQTLLMSCRVFGRNVEHAFLAYLEDEAKKEGCLSFTISFVKTEKNAPAEEFINECFTDRKMVFDETNKKPEWVKVITK